MCFGRWRRLPHARFQHPLFRNELLGRADDSAAGSPSPQRNSVGSWAGAMGQPQFLPSSYLTYAVDFDGDGSADIWTSVPDVLASIANYLHKSGWQPGLPWGFEVDSAAKLRLPRKPRHIRAMDGARTSPRRRRGVPAAATRFCFFPAALADRPFSSLRISSSSSNSIIRMPMRSRSASFPTGYAAYPPSAPAWPANDFQPSRDERIALQRRLADAWLQGCRFQRPSRFRSARRHPRNAAAVRHDRRMAIRAARFWSASACVRAVNGGAASRPSPSAWRSGRLPCAPYRECTPGLQTMAFGEPRELFR